MSDETYAIIIIASILIFVISLALIKPYLYQQKIRKAILDDSCTKCGKSLKESEILFETNSKGNTPNYWTSKCHSCREKNSFKNHLPLETFESAPN